MIEFIVGFFVGSIVAFIAFFVHYGSKSIVSTPEDFKRVRDYAKHLHDYDR